MKMIEKKSADHLGFESGTFSLQIQCLPTQTVKSSDLIICRHSVRLCYGLYKTAKIDSLSNQCWRLLLWNFIVIILINVMYILQSCNGERIGRKECSFVRIMNQSERSTSIISCASLKCNIFKAVVIGWTKWTFCDINQSDIMLEGKSCSIG